MCNCKEKAYCWQELHQKQDLTIFPNSKMASFQNFTWEKIVSAIRYSYLKGTGRPTMKEAHSFRLALHEPINRNNKN